MAKMSDNTTPEADAFRTGYVIGHFPRPWKIVPGKKGNNEAWVIQDAMGRELKLSGRGMLAAIVSVMNSIEV